LFAFQQSKSFRNKSSKDPDDLDLDMEALAMAAADAGTTADITVAKATDDEEDEGGGGAAAANRRRRQQQRRQASMWLWRPRAAPAAVDDYCLIGFPLFFLAFNVLYWSILLTHAPGEEALTDGGGGGRSHELDIYLESLRQFSSLTLDRGRA